MCVRGFALLVLLCVCPCILLGFAAACFFAAACLCGSHFILDEFINALIEGRIFFALIGDILL